VQKEINEICGKKEGGTFKKWEEEGYRKKDHKGLWGESKPSIRDSRKENHSERKGKGEYYPGGQCTKKE